MGVSNKKIGIDIVGQPKKGSPRDGNGSMDMSLPKEATRCTYSNKEDGKGSSVRCKSPNLS